MPSTDLAARRPPPLPDPRPRVVEVDGQHVIAGWRCGECGFPTAVAVAWCPRCRSAVGAEHFGPDGSVWSSTVVRVPLPGRTPPYTLAYVDLVDGPRILAHVEDAGTALGVGTAVSLVVPSVDGDVQVAVHP